MDIGLIKSVEGLVRCGFMFFQAFADELTLFCSVGLAGTEVVVADAAFKSLK